MKEVVYLALLLESCEVSDSLRAALTAAAKLLMDCKCQNARKQEALAAVGMANAAIDKLVHLNVAISKLLAEPPEVLQ